MHASSPALHVPALREAPLFAALALALGIAAPAAPALAAAPATARTPQERLVQTLHRQRADLKRQLAARAHPVAPGRRGPAGAPAVTNCEDSGAGSLRAALDAAVSGDVIDLTGLQCSTITLTSGALTVAADDVTLKGPGRDRLAIDGGNADRVIDHTGYDGTLTLDALTIRNGSYTYDGPGVYGSGAPGGCIFSRRNVTITHSAIEHCSARGKSVSGAAIDAWGGLVMTDSIVSGATAVADSNDISATIYGGVVSASVAYLTRATISDATVSASSTGAFSGLLGGGLFAMYGMVLTDSTVTGITAQVSAAKDAYAKGGGIASPTTIILSGSTISNNAVRGTPGLGPSGAYTYSSAIGGGGIYLMSIPRGIPVASTITDSTISGNTATCDGVPGAYTFGGGGGLATWSAVQVSITNSTFSGNRSDLDGGAIYTRHLGSVALSNATITDNTAPDGTGISANGDSSPFDLVTYSSIIAGNHAPDGGTATDIATIHAITGAHNLIGSADAALPPDTLGGDPRLAPLADNGGATLTHALLPDSPAIDAGSNPSHLAADQRGGTYARVSGAAADIGAFERQVDADAIFADGFD
jgi:predicted outer membrane repeat protein